ncbi:peptidoglycan-binding domain-containing protein [Gilvibacter sp.]|uniref:peptidoglycan-binding domain-containing protein n=1 Tax=Gilvibacter sp. TaxID=2729997 RepID=UPI0025BD4560|nr:peptidoglycan-binding domain-containing protein [Gilvibacter sp.]NQX76721.1 peptidoglycan-binding protein [Gilvibacter sp.]
MKQIIIFLLLIIVGIMGYNAYSKYKRFNPPGSEYQASKPIDLNYFDPNVVEDYHHAVARLNGYAVQMWSFHGIDVRAPKKDNAATKEALVKYEELMATLKAFEAKLEESASLKEQGLTNMQIKSLGQNEPKSAEDQKTKNQMLLDWLSQSPNDFDFGMGEQGPLVYELQGILINMGYELEHDGIFRIATSSAVEAFETKNGFYADGRMDPITAYALLAN